MLTAHLSEVITQGNSSFVLMGDGAFCMCALAGLSG